MAENIAKIVLKDVALANCQWGKTWREI